MSKTGGNNFIMFILCEILAALITEFKARQLQKKILMKTKRRGIIAKETNTVSATCQMTNSNIRIIVQL